MTEPAPASTHPAESRFPEAYALLRQAIQNHAFPCCAFGLLAGDQILLLDALGQFTYQPDSPPVQPHTVFDVASITKVAVTTAVAMLLHQRGHLDLDTPLGDLLPAFVIGRSPSEKARQVTIRHLLAHSSGLPGYRPLFAEAQSPFALLRACLELPLLAPPGTRMEYSDHGFILLAKALETITHEHLATWVAREVYLPLGMTASRHCPTAHQRPLIPPTEIDELYRQRIIQGEVQDEHAHILKGAGGHAGLFSSVADLLTFAREILKPTVLFHPDTIDTFATPQPPDGSSRALGWDTPSPDSSAGQFFGPGSIGHLGFSGCSLWMDRSAGIAIVLLTNRTWPDRSAQAIRQIRPAFHDAIRRAL
jgi:serine-type D-Ala-D-Ala carboxypeptidase